MNISRMRKNKNYANILSKIQQTLPAAIIAGGAIRDLCHNKPVKDIDIYVPCETLNIYDTLCAYEEDFWDTIFTTSDANDYIEQSGDDSYDGINHIGMVWEIQSADIMYNIILVDTTPAEYVENYFDIGLCKAYFDGNRFRLTADFMRDSTNKTLTVVGKNIKQPEFDNIMRGHVSRLQKKYPNHSIVIPDVYEEMYKKFIESTI